MVETGDVRMNIDANIINEKALLLITDTLTELYDFTDDSADFSNTRLATLGEIRGICMLASGLREFFKTEAEK